MATARLPRQTTGSVVWYKEDRGYGFIRDEEEGGEYFIHRTSILDGDVLVKGDAVTFELDFDVHMVIRASTLTGGRVWVRVDAAAPPCWPRWYTGASTAQSAFVQSSSTDLWADAVIVSRAASQAVETAAVAAAEASAASSTERIRARAAAAKVAAIAAASATQLAATTVAAAAAAYVSR